MAMELCAFKIGEHVWKVVSRDTSHGNLLVERVPRFKPDEAKKTFVLDPMNDCCLVFCYVRTNQNGVKEYGFIDAGRMVKEDGKGNQREETKEGKVIDMRPVQGTVGQEGPAGYEVPEVRGKDQE